LKGFDYLFGGMGEKYFGSRKITNRIFQVSFLLFSVIGASTDILTVMSFSDMMILAMGIPNLIGLFILAPEIKEDLNEYWNRMKSGELLRKASE